MPGANLASVSILSNPSVVLVVSYISACHRWVQGPLARRRRQPPVPRRTFPRLPALNVSSSRRKLCYISSFIRGVYKINYLVESRELVVLFKFEVEISLKRSMLTVNPHHHRSSINGHRVFFAREKWSLFEGSRLNLMALTAVLQVCPSRLPLTGNRTTEPSVPYGYGAQPYMIAYT